MKFLLLIFIMSAWIITSAQPSGIVLQQGNSCHSYFKNKKISIRYSYRASTQTHDYSNNWDFDGDGKTDGLYFIGTGGAHLYFYLRIVLSSDKKKRNFSFLELDMPCLGSIDELKNSKLYPNPAFPQFVVDDFISKTNNKTDKIYLRLDKHFNLPLKWKKRGINSSCLLLKYEKGEMVLEDFKL
jgi:hypothetical protein